MKPPPRRTSTGFNHRGGLRRGTGRSGDGRKVTGYGREGAKPQRRPLPPDILRRVDSDPLFAVVTSDQQHWIDPYTGTPVPASQGRVQAAREYLTETGAWRDREPLARQALDAIRWRLELMRLLPVDPRLRIFGRDGRGWLNPFTGDLVEGISREDGKITVRTVAMMAQHLSGCLPAQGGRILDNQALMARVQALGIGKDPAPVAQQPKGQQPGSGSGSQLVEDMARAKSVQQNMLPDLPAIEGYELAVHYAGHSGVSGDFYEALPLRDGHLLLVLGDVSGHGMQAALVVATALKTLRLLSRHTSDPLALLAQFNDEIRNDLLPGQFITLFAAALDPVQRRMMVIRAGHHPGVIVNLGQNTVLRRIGLPGTAIGLVPGAVFARALKPEMIDLQPGDVLLQYTDGITEATDADGVEFGESRLFGSLLGNLELPLQQVVDEIAREVLDFAGGTLADDLTVLSLAVLAPEEDEAADDADASGTRSG